MPSTPHPTARVIRLLDQAPAVDADAVVVLTAKPTSGDGSAAAATDEPPQLLPGAEQVDAAFDGRLAEVLADLGAAGDEGEVVRLATLDRLSAPVLAAAGTGPVAANGGGGSGSNGGVGTEAVRRAVGAAVRALAGKRRVALAVPTDPVLAEAAVEGALLAAYAVRVPSPRKAPVSEVVLLGAPTDAMAANPGQDEVVSRSSTLAASVLLARQLGNLPAGDLSPAAFADRATAEAQSAGVDVQVWDEQALAEQGFGGICGVGAGSSRPPRLVRLAWSPPEPRRRVALVGKGITFDSGGLSLKPPTGMEYMKIDMAGAAAVLGAVLAAARLELPVAVTGWLAIAENLPSATAYRPTDVLRIYGGKQVEVLNTDAEGRLVLADALARAAEEDPDLLVDVATLTGGQVVALGQRTSGLMGNDENLVSAIRAASERSGEPVWPMPMPPEVRRTLDSTVADLKNVPGGANRDAHMLVGGIFLREFVPDRLPWAHLDIAGPAWNGGEPYGYTPKGATGVMVRTLVALLEDSAE